MRVQKFVQIALSVGLWLVPLPMGHAGELSLEGNVIQGGLVQGHTRPNATVKVDGRQVRVSTEGLFLVGFDRDAPKQSTLLVTYQDGTQEKRVLQVKRRTYKIQRVNGLPPRTVNPKKEDVAKIKKEARQAREARRRDDPRTDFRGGFIWPVIGPISGVFGSQRILNGEPRRPHYGVDVAAKVGTLVRAPADGIVTLVHANMFFSGGTMILDHGHGLSSSFLHLNKILVKEGDRIQQGDIIAEVGATGRVSGPHLDWRMNVFKKRIDPQLLVGPMPAK